MARWTSLAIVSLAASILAGCASSRPGSDGSAGRQLGKLACGGGHAQEPQVPPGPWEEQHSGHDDG